MTHADTGKAKQNSSVVAHGPQTAAALLGRVGDLHINQCPKPRRWQSRDRPHSVNMCLCDRHLTPSPGETTCGQGLPRLPTPPLEPSACCVQPRLFRLQAQHTLSHGDILSSWCGMSPQQSRDLPLACPALTCHGAFWTRAHWQSPWSCMPRTNLKHCSLDSPALAPPCNAHVPGSSTS